jgi:hypothetical protein
MSVLEKMFTLPERLAQFETVHIKELQFLQKPSSSQANMYPVPSTLLHAHITQSQLLSAFNCLKMCL